MECCVWLAASFRTNKYRKCGRSSLADLPIVGAVRFRNDSDAFKSLRYRNAPRYWRRRRVDMTPEPNQYASEVPVKLKVSLRVLALGASTACAQASPEAAAALIDTHR